MSSEVFKGLEACRDAGQCNMFDITCVVAWLMGEGYFATVQWIIDNKSDYAKGIMYGFDVEN